MPANAAQDEIGNLSSAASTFTVNFDATAPSLISSRPQNNAMDVPLAQLTVTLQFNELVTVVSGNIQLVQVSTEQTVETLSLLGSSVTREPSAITANFATTLEQNEQYRIVVNSSSVADVAGNVWSGLQGDSLIFTAANEPPNSSNDSAALDEDSTVDIAVLENDSDAIEDLDISTLVVDTAPLHGTATVDSQLGIINYKPNANFNGADSFTYTVADIQGSVSEPATVAITVNPINDAPVAENDTVSTEEEQQLVITILDNDSDVDETSNIEPNTIDPGSVVIEVQPSSGEVSVVDEISASENEELQVGQVIYMPDVNFFGTDTFSYTVKDTLGLVSSAATVTISVGNVNDAPVANNDSVSTQEDEAVVINVVSNDTDNEGEVDAQSVTLQQQGELGSATVNSNTGEVIYTPDTNKFGTDTIIYSVKDSEGVQSNFATVTIEIVPVNDAPQAVNDTFAINTRSPSRLNVIGNDTDPDTVDQPSNTIDVESVVVVTVPVFGEVQVEASTGTLIYTPNEGAIDETDSFTYQVTDTQGAVSNTASVSIKLQLQSANLVANNDSAATQEDNAVAINVLVNDGDPTRELNSASVKITVAANNGVAESDADGVVTYTPNTNFFGEDSFSYTVQDINGDTSNDALVTVTVAPVNDAPSISGTPTTTVIAGKAYQFKPSVSDIDSNTLTFSIENKPAWGTFNGATGELAGVPDETDAGLYENITVTVSDEEGLSARLLPFTIEVISKASLTPTAFNANVQAVEDEAVAIAVQASDPNNLPLIYEVIQQPQSGTLSGSLPNVIYTPNENYFGLDSFEFTASNGEYTSSPATISVNVEAVNDAPIANDDETTVLQGQSITINALENDTDVEDGQLTIAQATVGQGTVNIAANTLNYTAPINFAGVAIINYSIADEEGLTASAQVLVTVTKGGDDSSSIVLNVPDDVTVNATGLVTRVSLGEATATDNFGNIIPVTLQTPPFFKPGKHTVVWQAQKGDEVQQQSQLVTVNPMVSIEPEQRVQEGQQATINVFLNGEAPSYPVNIPYTVAGTSDSSDHNLTNGTLVITSGTEASISVDISSDVEADGNETLIVTIQPALNTTNAQHTLTIVEGSVEPALQLSATQSNTRVTTIYPQLGQVDIELTILNKELSDIDFVDWSASSSALNALNVSTVDTAFSFAPNSLDEGLYHVRVSVSEKAGLTGEAEITLVVNSAPPQLTAEDTDGDGVPDNQEGIGDNDGDGIPNYLDANDECNVQLMGSTTTSSYLIEGDAGACFRIGDTAARNRTNSIVIDEGNVAADEGFTSIGETIDFVINGLPNKGAVYRLVIPQQNVVPSNAVYRKYDAASNGWNEFVVTGNNDALHSAKGEQGICPPPSATTWTEGLNAGDWCIRLTLSDGGPNDDDGIANASIADPSRLAIVASDNANPVANEDTVSVTTGDAGILNVLGNDTDEDGDMLTVVSANAYLGTVTLENNVIVYEPPVDFSGSDTVLYSISDGNGGIDSTLVTVLANVNNVPVAENDTAETDSDTAITINVLLNDSDADGDELTITSAQVDIGMVEIIDNQLLFTPQPERLGVSTISYRVEDGKGSVDEATVLVTVSAKVNQAPVAQNDSISTEENTAVTVNVLANDSDPDGDALTIVSATTSSGTVSIQGDSLVYTPASNFVGSAIIDYVITDGINEASATLTVRVIKPVGKSGGGSVSLALILLSLLVLMCRISWRQQLKRA
ncbi:hypothetical protein BM527_16445 [Alteromonas sp. Mex14]|nr:hypothetical protein BM527_16445 [Alteromonas sp. Mex14]